MKSLFSTPAAGQIQYVKDSQDDAVNFVNQDQCTSICRFIGVKNYVTIENWVLKTGL